MIKSCISFFFIILISCNNKSAEKEEENTEFFPVISFLKSQTAHVDTSLYNIIKIVTANNVSDTVYLKREQFRDNAKEFLTLPDLSGKNLKKKYTETEMYDEELKAVILNYSPNKGEGEIRRQEVLITPNEHTGDEVKSIFIDRLLDSKDSTVQKRMTWNVNKDFQIITIISKPDGSERVETLKVIWNNFSFGG
jgi:HD superfamily phosphohydrolase